MDRLREVVMSLAVLMAVPFAAHAQVSLHQDAAGRPITIDARVPGVDAAGYAAVIAGAVHGDEVSSVTIRVVRAARVPAACRVRRAAGCYERTSAGASTVIVPAERVATVTPILLHEYGHHVDASGEEPRWRAARAIEQRLAAGIVATDYSRGWAHAIGEIFAEDYVALNMHVRTRLIRWLPAPSAGVLDALRIDLADAGAPGAVG